MNPEGCDRLGGAVAPAALATTVRGAEVPPGGRPAAGADPAWLGNEAFDQDRMVAGVRRPVIGQTGARPREAGLCRQIPGRMTNTRHG